MAEHVALHEKLAESVRKFPVLYDKSSNDFKNKHKFKKNEHREIWPKKFVLQQTSHY